MNVFEAIRFLKKVSVSRLAAFAEEFVGVCHNCHLDAEASRLETELSAFQRAISRPRKVESVVRQNDVIRKIKKSLAAVRAMLENAVDDESVRALDDYNRVMKGHYNRGKVDLIGALTSFLTQIEKRKLQPEVDALLSGLRQQADEFAELRLQAVRERVRIKQQPSACSLAPRVYAQIESVCAAMVYMDTHAATHHQDAALVMITKFHADFKTRGKGASESDTDADAEG